MHNPLKKSLTALAVVLALTLTSNFSQAHPAGQAPCIDAMPCPGFDGKMPQKITDEQRAKYYAICKEFEPKLRELNDQLFVKKNELEALKHAVQPRTLSHCATRSALSNRPRKIALPRNAA